jgi:lactoylglutathione lyase
VINRVHKIVVPVSDETAAIEFWTTRVGFELTRDERYGAGQRWVEVTPPDRSLVLVLSRRGANDPQRDVPPQLPHSPVFFDCDDIQETYRELVARGVAFPAPPVLMPFGWWAMFEDSDGTRYALTQSRAGAEQGA